MLSGCPDCGGNKFQFKPAGATTDEDPTPAEQSHPTEQSQPTEQPHPTAQPKSSEQSQPTARADATAETDSTPTVDADPSSTVDADTASPADTTSASDADTSPSPTEQSTEPSDADDSPPEPSESADPTTGTEHVRERSEEDVAQASARSDVVSPDELDRATQPVSSTDDAGPTDGPRPDIDELRDELNEQFESIKIVSPGKYELNLMELYDRQEYIISLQEDGRYIIEMPDAWGIDDE
jgi:hypothetical protein